MTAPLNNTHCCPDKWILKNNVAIGWISIFRENICNDKVSNCVAMTITRKDTGKWFYVDMILNI